MDKIRLIGIGSCGANIVKEFDTYEDVYDLTYIDNERHNFGEGHILPKVSGLAHEEYDKLEHDYVGIEGDASEVQIFISGASDISGAILRILKHLSDNDVSVNIFYIKPELKFLSELQKTQDKITFGILQNYARSGLVDSFIIFDNAVLGQLVGKVAIADYFPAINQKIAQFVHTYNFCSKNDPIFGQKNDFLEITRIGCLGYGNIEEDIILFYNLQSVDDETVFPLEIQYNFLVPEGRIKNDENLMTEILEIVEKEEEKYKSISYGVFSISSEQEDVGVLVYLRTSKIQSA